MSGSISPEYLSLIRFILSSCETGCPAWGRKEEADPGSAVDVWTFVPDGAKETRTPDPTMPL